MKKIVIALIAISFFIACGKARSVKQLALEVCQCAEKANNPQNIDRKKVTPDDCMKMHEKVWAKIKNDSIDMEEYKIIVGNCTAEQAIRLNQ